MSQEKTFLEVIAPTVEDAIEKGMTQLGVSRDDIEIEVLDEGNRGIFGLGNRQARIKLTIVTDESHFSSTEPGKTLEKEDPGEEVTSDTKESEEISEENSAEGLSTEEENILDVARNVVEELLLRMKVKTSVHARFRPSQESDSESAVLVDISGDDLSILIGRRAETLNALQYISGLIISKELGRWIPLTIDVQGYRQRREQQIRQLACRMAEQAEKTGRRQSLEPMSANERRLVHLELRNHENVITESVGEDPYRKVTIILK
ncbi:MAG: Jag N-terminal domain-containing protein [Anaerolineaceae bacterium]|nr:Jag N-terminal domain-containing protein [Anaerolineaceae bacterium]